jgi:hypothetical protein
MIVDIYRALSAVDVHDVGAGDRQGVIGRSYSRRMLLPRREMSAP